MYKKLDLPIIERRFKIPKDFNISNLPDVQSSTDLRGIALNRVGVGDLKFPLVIRQRGGGTQLVHATIDTFGSLLHSVKGVNMCYDNETEILTRKRGWVKFKDLTIRDEVATLNLRSRTFEWQKVIKKSTFSYIGKMCQFDNSDINLKVTPTHNLVVLDKDNKLVLLKACEVMTNNTFKTIKTCNWNSFSPRYFEVSLSSTSFSEKHTLTFEIIDFMKLLGFYIARGYCSNKNSEQIVFTSYNVKTLNEIISILKKVGLNPQLTAIPHDKKCFKLNVNSKTLYSFFCKLGEASKRYIPEEIKNFGTQELQVLLQYYYKGDNTRHTNVFYTTSKKLADDLQEIYIKCGKNVHINTKRFTKGSKSKLFYEGCILSKENVYYNSKKNKSKWVNYFGNVYCCEVPNHTLLVRRKGIPVWSGNSRFARVLMQWHKRPLSGTNFKELLEEIKRKTNCGDVYISASFPYCVKKVAPISKEVSVLAYDCKFIGKLTNNKYDYFLQVKVPVNLTCPCSKELSLYDTKSCLGKGAHNQRAEITAQVKVITPPGPWFETLIKILESSGSCDLYTVLKREDEKFVTEWAYTHPKFVEDAAREAAVKLQKLKTIKWLRVKVQSFESIHQHSAFAYVSRVLKGKTWRKSDEKFY